MLATGYNDSESRIAISTAAWVDILDGDFVKLANVRFAEIYRVNVVD